MSTSRSILWCTHADLGNQGATTYRYYITHGQAWVNDTYIDIHNYSARGAIVMINVGLFQACPNNTVLRSYYTQGEMLYSLTAIRIMEI